MILDYTRVCDVWTGRNRWG